MPSQCNYEQTIYGESRRCQFDQRADKLTDLGGKSWCRFHLPAKCQDQSSDKLYINQPEEDWDRFLANFNSAVFDYIDFRHREIQRLVESDSMTGNYEIDLSGVVFPGDIDFRKCPDAERGFVSLNLCGAEFNRTVDFTGLTFFGVTMFLHTRFCHQAIFDGSRFERVSFRHAFFHGAATFPEASVSDIADFRDTIFNGIADFSKMRYEEKAEVSFEDAEFRYGSFFRETGFSSAATFRNTLFGGGTDFSEAVFDRDVSFEQSIDAEKKVPGRSVPRDIVHNMWFVSIEGEGTGRWVMENTRFRRRATFRGREFLIPTSFRSAEFDLAPEFHDVKFDRDTDLSGIIFNDFVGHEHADAAGAYRVLQQAAKPVVSNDDAINISALRQTALVHSSNTPLFHKLILRGFGYAADYGRNLPRLIVFIVLNNVAFFAIYEFVSWSGWDEAGKCLSFAVNQLVNPYALWAESYAGGAAAYIAADLGLFRFLATIQTTISGLLLSAFAWTIQIRFRIF